MRITSMIAVVGALAAALPATANAAITIDAGTTVTTSGPTGSDIDFSIGLSDSGTTSPFAEILRFTNTLAGLYNFTLDSSSADLNITSAYVTGTGIGAPISLDNLLNSGALEFWGKAGVALGSGTFDLTIEGTRTSGSFGGSVSCRGSGAPETATPRTTWRPEMPNSQAIAPPPASP